MKVAGAEVLTLEGFDAEERTRARDLGAEQRQLLELGESLLESLSPGGGGEASGEAEPIRPGYRIERVRR